MAGELAFDCLVSHYGAARPMNWARHFGRAAPLVLEIGSGHGDFILQSAQANPQTDFVGIEQEWERVKKTLRKIQMAAESSTDKTRVQNICILQMDVVVALERLFRPLSLQKAYCLFPCPWPKKRHVKHRLFSPEFLKLLNSRLEPQGEAQIVTDAYPYFTWVLEQIEGTGFRYETRVIQSQYNTKYERKWSAQGQREFYELRLLKDRPMAVALKEDIPLRVYLAKAFVPERFEVPDQTGEVTIIFKDFLWDRDRQKAMVRLVISEKNMRQQLWVAIRHCPQGWSIAKSEGCPIIPTAGIAQAIGLVAESVAKSADCEFWATDEKNSPDDNQG